MTHAMIPQEQKMKGGSKDGHIRTSVVLERARDIVDDLLNSLNLCDNKGCDVPEDLLLSMEKYNGCRPPQLCGGYIYIL